MCEAFARKMNEDATEHQNLFWKDVKNMRNLSENNWASMRDSIEDC